MHNSNNYEKPYFIEKLVSALSYITSGFVGFIWLLLGIFTKSRVRPFMKYHIFQSIFLAIAYFLLCQIHTICKQCDSYGCLPFKCTYSIWNIYNTNFNIHFNGLPCCNLNARQIQLSSLDFRYY